MSQLVLVFKYKLCRHYQHKDIWLTDKTGKKKFIIIIIFLKSNSEKSNTYWKQDPFLKQNYTWPQFKLVFNLIASNARLFQRETLWNKEKVQRKKMNPEKISLLNAAIIQRIEEMRDGLYLI